MDFSGQERVAELGRSGQKKLSTSAVTVVGVGALGTMVSGLLLRSGTGKLILVDRDIVQEANLASQHLYTQQDVGLPKASAARSRLLAIAPQALVEARAEEVGPASAERLLSEGLVIDCTDNFETRHIINEHCRKHAKEWVHGAALATRGNAVLFRPDSFCFNCLFEHAKPRDTCESAGIMVMTAALVACLEVSLALRQLTGQGVPGELVRVDAWRLSVDWLKPQKRKGCSVCSGSFPHLKQEEQSLLKMCGGGLYQTRLTIPLREAEKVLRRYGKVIELRGAIRAGPFTLFPDRRVLVKARSEQEARKVLAGLLRRQR